MSFHAHAYHMQNFEQDTTRMSRAFKLSFSMGTCNLWSHQVANLNDIEIERLLYLPPLLFHDSRWSSDCSYSEKVGNIWPYPWCRGWLLHPLVFCNPMTTPCLFESTKLWEYLRDHTLSNLSLLCGTLWQQLPSLYHLDYLATWSRT